MKFVAMVSLALLMIASFTNVTPAFGRRVPPLPIMMSPSDCGIDWDAKIDSSDGFVKVRATNTCDFSVRFIVAVYHTDGTVNRTRNYCYAPKQTGIITIGKGDWIHRVAVESPSRC